MARWDSEELLEKFKLYGQIPANTVYPTDAQIYGMLRDAQEYVMVEMASQAPHVNMGAPTQLSTSDGGYTYKFGTDTDGDPIFPIGHVEVAARDGGRILYGGTYFSGSLDFVAEGDRIRMPRGVAKTFASGPFARFVTPPGALNADNEPVLKPKHARILIVYRALVQWANIGGKKDPRPYQEEYDRIWYGEPEKGNGGLLYSLKSQFEQGNYASNPYYYAEWWNWLDAIHAEAGNQ